MGVGQPEAHCWPTGGIDPGGGSGTPLPGPLGRVILSMLHGLPAVHPENAGGLHPCPGPGDRAELSEGLNEDGDRDRQREASAGFEMTPLVVASEGRKDSEAGAEMLGLSHSIVGAHRVL